MFFQNSFHSIKDQRMVEYKSFCFEIEKAFANNELEKNPLIEAEQHVPSDPIFNIQLTPDEEECVVKSLRNIAERVSIIIIEYFQVNIIKFHKFNILKVRQQRIQLFPPFEDFDRLKNGYVTQNQFTRVLNDLKLRTVLENTELENLIKKYSVRIGTRDDINYVAFSDQIYDLGSFEFRYP